jgi:hypothetical protein
VGPTARDWLGAGLLAIVMVVLIVLLVTSAMGADEGAEAAFRVFA